MYDTLIIGGGVAGLAAAMYAGRLAMKTLLIAETLGGTIILTDRVENYPGFLRLTGQELADNLKNHVLDYKEYVEIKEKTVDGIKRKKDNECFVVTMGNESVQGKTIIYATGTKWRELDVPGNQQYKNKGVHFCALCDGFFYRAKTVAVVGGGDSAVKEALVLTEHADRVYIISRGKKIKAEPPNIRRLEQNDKIAVIYETNVVEIKGNDNGVTHVVLDKPFNKSKELRIDGLFLAIGHTALTDLAQKMGVKVNQKGEIIINRNSETNVPGFFAAGDVVDTHFKQAIVGVGEAVLAAYGAYEYINSKEIACPR